ncbi:MAG: divergent polysaccharide deacetylase family protein [Solirubrobacterales bacterium]
MLTLDEDEPEAAIDFAVVEPTPPRSINLRPILVGLGVLVVGGGLGTAGYFLQDLDVRDVIGVLDVADNRPRLSMEMPGRAGAPPSGAAPSAPAAPVASPAAKPETAGGLLTPPAPVAPPSPASSAAPAAVQLPTITPPAAGAGTAPAMTPAVAAPAIPVVPQPREGSPVPSFANLPNPNPGKALAAAPIDILQRNSPVGPLPVIGMDGRQPWKEYGLPFTVPPGKPAVAVVVTGLGLDREATDAAIKKLPAEVTLAFSPYAPTLDKWVKQARTAGHEVLLALPTEPSGFPGRDPGPLGLLTSSDAEENLTRLESVLARAAGYVGVLAEDGPFVRSPKHLATVFSALKERGLLYVGDGTRGGDVPPNAAIAEIADQDPFRDAIDARLARAAAQAKDVGRAVVVVQARPLSLDRAVDWMLKMKDQGVVVAPASALATSPGKS